jgi:hypothetical protein
MDNQETTQAEHSKACIAFADGIQHPNERTLAQEILGGATVAGDFSLGFDHSQVKSMTDRLISAGCDTVAEAVSEEEFGVKGDEEAEEAEAPSEDTPSEEGADQAPEATEDKVEAGESTAPEAGTDTPSEDAPVQTDTDTQPEAPKVDGQGQDAPQA